MTQQNGVVARAQLSQLELEAVSELVGACMRKDNADPRIIWDGLIEQPSDLESNWLFYADKGLVGFLTLDGLGDEEAECAAVVHPNYRRRGVFRALVAAARAACAAAGTGTLLLVADRNSKAAKLAGTALGATVARTEHKMALDKAARKRVSIPFALDVAPATPDDAPLIAALLAEDDGSDAEALVGFATLMMQRPGTRYFVARRGSTPIATLRLVTQNTQRFIYGFLVAQNERGKGYGREMLLRTLQYAFASYNDPVFLEVDATNAPALHLYRSVGFQVETTFDYYRIASA